MERSTSTTITILWCSLLAVLLAGYLAQFYLPPPTPRLVGIDLGTTFSCVGVYEAVTGRISIIPSRDSSGGSHLTIPSVVHFSNEGISTGYEALRRANGDPSNAIYDAKRFIGKTFTQEELRNITYNYPFKMVLENDTAKFEVTSQANIESWIPHLVTPEFVGSRLIDVLRSSAEFNLNVPINKAVMAVPADFDERQRYFTKAAAKLAGLEVLRIINEPTAAALAYGLHKKENVNNVIVVDVGGGTSDVSILNVQHGMFLTRAIAGNNYLGGQDFNQRLFQYLKDVVVSSTSGQTLTNPVDVHTLQQAVEEAKLQLTKNAWFVINVELPSIDYVLHYNLTRQIFEQVNADLFAKINTLLDIVLREAEMSADDIDEIVLVGGSTRIPKVRRLIADYFGMLPNTSLDPELAVAHGVAIQAGIIGGMWPLQVSAIEIPTTLRKIHVQ